MEPPAGYRKPDEEVVYRNEVGAELVENAYRFVSKQAAQRFLGYLQAQKSAMTGEVGAHTNRPELVAIHGYDTKYAMHAARLGFQGVELLTTGGLSLPMAGEPAEWLRAVRRGEVGFDEWWERSLALDAHLERLEADGDIPDAPDRGRIEGWVVDAHLRWWGRQ